VKYMLLKDARKIRRVAVQDIVCCEAQKKQQYVYMADGTRLIPGRRQKSCLSFLPAADSIRG